jgi:branched-chain amino acid transport system ATP-binding protein
MTSPPFCVIYQSPKNKAGDNPPRNVKTAIDGRPNRPDDAGSGESMELAEAKAGGADVGVDPHASALLMVNGVTMRFGGVTALQDVSFEVARGAICGLIGPNGAGKTTLFNCISRLYDPGAGSILFDGRPLASFARHELASLGIARTFQNVALFSTMTVRENVCVGAHAIGRGGFLANALATPLARREELKIAERADALIEEFGLKGVADRPAGTLPFGVRKRVELARALAKGPKLLLLDEPAGGLNHSEVDGLADEIRAIRDRRGVAVLLVEHHMNLVMRVSDQVVALDFGRVIANGRPDEVRANREVVRAYLGSAG